MKIKPIGVQKSTDSSHRCSKCKKNIPAGKTVYLVNREGEERGVI